MAKVIRIREAQSPAKGTKPVTSTALIVIDLRFDKDSFRRIKCSRKVATWHQKNLYSLNKNHVHGWQFATRYDYRAGELLIWRMS